MGAYTQDKRKLRKAAALVSIYLIYENLNSLGFLDKIMPDSTTQERIKFINEMNSVADFLKKTYKVNHSKLKQIEDIVSSA